MTCDRYHLLFFGTRNILFSASSFHLVFCRGPQPILFCMHSIVPTRSCNLLRIIILVSTLYGSCPIVMMRRDSGTIWLIELDKSQSLGSLSGDYSRSDRSNRMRT